MATNDTAKPRVPAERPHPRAAARDPGAGAEDRPGSPPWRQVLRRSSSVRPPPP